MRRTAGFVLAGLLVALVAAGLLSNFASTAPDGLESTARQGCTTDADGTITGGNCIAQGARDHELADSPLGGYGIRGISNAYLSTGLSGVLGVLLTFALGGGLFWLVRRRGPDRPRRAERARGEPVRPQPAEPEQGAALVTGPGQSEPVGRS